MKSSSTDQFGPAPLLLVLAPTVEDHLGPSLAALCQLTTSHHSNPDLLVLNQDQAGITIDRVRKLRSDAAFPPYHGAERAAILLHLDQASVPAQQALLTFFEEPPQYLRLVATTSQLSSILPTIQSRCLARVVPDANLVPSATTTADATTNLKPDSNVETTLRQLLTKQLSYTDVISLSESYSERDQALAFLSQLMTAVRQHSSYPSPLLVTASQALATHWVQLGQNTNVRLTLENCFFTIISRF